MSLLIFAIIVVLIVVLLLWAVRLLPIDATISTVLQVAVILVGVIVICNRAGLV